MSRRAIGEGSGKAITPGEITLTHGPITKDFSLGAPPKGVPPSGTPKKTISPIPPPYLHHSDGGVPGGFDTGSGSHGSGWSTTTGQLMPNPKVFVRANCIWHLDKNTLGRYEKHWVNTLQREWHPDVALAFQDKIEFDVSSPERYHRAQNLLDTFIWHHLDLDQPEVGAHLAVSIENARHSGVIVARNGKSLLDFLREWIIITDKGDAANARKGLMDMKILPQFTLVELEEAFWWATAIKDRLPVSERTAECDVIVRMLEGMTGVLATRKVALETQLETLKAMGKGVSDTEFLQMMNYQLSSYRVETSTASKHSEQFVQPGFNAKTNPTNFYTHEDKDKGKRSDVKCFGCGDKHSVKECKKPPCKLCRRRDCGANFPTPTECMTKYYAENGKFPADVKNATGSAMNYMQKGFIIKASKKLNEKNEQSNMTTHGDLTASQIRAMERNPEDAVSFTIVHSEIEQPPPPCRKCGTVLTQCEKCYVTVCNRCKTPCVCDADLEDATSGEMPLYGEHSYPVASVVIDYAESRKGPKGDEECVSCAPPEPRLAPTPLPTEGIAMMLRHRPHLAPSSPPPAGCVRVLVDSGSTCNCYNDRRDFHEEKVRDPTSLTVGGCNPKAPLKCKLNCDIALELYTAADSATSVLPLAEFMYVPGMPHIVISSGYYLDEHDIEFDYKAMLVRMPDGQTAPMHRHNQLFYVHAVLNKQGVCNVIVADKAKRHALLWHSRFGGLDADTARSLATTVRGVDHGINDDAVAHIENCNIDASAIDECEIQKLVRMRTPTRPGYTPVENKARRPGQRLVLDGWPMEHAPSIVSRHTYLMLVADECSGTGFLKSTVEHTAVKWFQFVKHLQAKLKLLNDDATVQAVRVDNSGEFRNVKEWEEQLTSISIVLENSPFRHHHAVGAASAMQLDLARIANHMMQRCSRNKGFVIYAIKYANVVRNMKKARGRELPRIELLTHRRPDASRLRVFGCDAYAHVAKEAREHLAPGVTSVKGVFVGLEGSKWLVFANSRIWETENAHFYESPYIVKGVPPSKILVHATTQTSQTEHVAEDPSGAMPKRLTDAMRYARNDGEAGRAATRSSKPVHASLMTLHEAWTRSTDGVPIIMHHMWPQTYATYVMGENASIEMEVGDIEVSSSYAAIPIYAPDGVQFEADCDDQGATTAVCDVPEQSVHVIKLESIPTITLDGPQGKYTMPNPSTWAQAKVTPQAAQWEQAIRGHIAQLERDGLKAVPISWAKSKLSDGDVIHPSQLTLRVKRDSATNHMAKLQARGCLDGREWDKTAEGAITSSTLPPEGVRLLQAEAALEQRITIIGDVSNAYPKSDWLDGRHHFLSMFKGFEEYTEDGEQMVYWSQTPLFGAPPAGACWEKKLKMAITAGCGGVPSSTMAATYDVPTMRRPVRIGTVVDDMIITVPRDMPEMGEFIMDTITKQFVEVKWNVDPTSYAFNGVQATIDLPRRAVTIHITLKIEAAIDTYAPDLKGCTDIAYDVAVQSELDKLVMVDKELRADKLSKEQKHVTAQIGLLIYFIEYVVTIVHPVHRLTFVMPYPPEHPAKAVLARIWKYLYTHRHVLGNTFGGELSDEREVSASAAYTPLAQVPSGQRLFVADATWTGSQERSIKAYAIKWYGGTLSCGAKSIHAIMPSSFLAEAEAVHDVVEYGNYLVDRLVEMGHLAQTANLTLCDNEGLVKTLQLKAKGGSKLHRRKLGIILQNIERERYKIAHISTHQMPVDMLTKLVGKKKAQQSLDFLYNTSNMVHQGAAMPATGGVAATGGVSSGPPGKPLRLRGTGPKEEDSCDSSMCQMYQLCQIFHDSAGISTLSDLKDARQIGPHDQPSATAKEADDRKPAKTRGEVHADLAGTNVRQNTKSGVLVITTGSDVGIEITKYDAGIGEHGLHPDDTGLHPSGSGGSGGQIDQIRGVRACPRGGDQFGNKKKKRKYCDSWGKGDKSGKESKRRKYKGKQKRKMENEMKDFERRAMLELHPQACPICLEEPKTMLLIDCEDRVNGHRQHGVCEDCVRDVMTAQAPRCPECNLNVHHAIYMGTAFFV